ncbi:MAG: transcriptional repressor [Verrucomicrobiales bacterium]|nr:transcriptional repressor [Verrucomicrobiae bacterium]
MVIKSDISSDSESAPALELGGDFRMTKQRREVYEVLMEERNHPTATEVFMRAKERMPSISLATVYNCLETMNQCGLVKKVNLDRSPSRYCANLQEHGHFYCEDCGHVEDIVLKPRVEAQSNFSQMWKLPKGAVVDHFEVAIRGTCPDCVTKAKTAKAIKK